MDTLIIAAFIVLLLVAIYVILFQTIKAIIEAIKAIIELSQLAEKEAEESCTCEKGDDKKE
jgi:hypothetical protein